MLIIDGKPATVDGASTVRDHIVFKPGQPNTSRQTEPWAGAGLHWTGSENKIEVFIRVLQDRKLSCHFWQDADGTLVQIADLSTRCAHIGSPGNGRFYGVETRCRGYATKDDLDAARQADPTLWERTELDWATPRDCYHDVIDGKRVGMAAFTPAQIERLLWLCETTSAIYKFPRSIPFEIATAARIASLPFSNGERYVVRHEGVDYLPSFDRDPGKRSKRALTHRGALGHLHLHDAKHDPGTAVFYALWAEGWNPAARKLPGVRLGA